MPNGWLICSRTPNHCEIPVRSGVPASTAALKRRSWSTTSGWWDWRTLQIPWRPLRTPKGWDDPGSGEYWKIWKWQMYIYILWYFNICYYMLLYIIMYNCILLCILYIMIYYYILFYVTICYYRLLYVSTYLYILLYIIILLYTIIYCYIFLHIVT